MEKEMFVDSPYKEYGGGDIGEASLFVADREWLAMFVQGGNLDM